MTYLFLFYVYGYFCLPFCLCSMCIQCPQKPEEGVSPPRTGITGHNWFHGKDVTQTDQIHQMERQYGPSFS